MLEWGIVNISYDVNRDGPGTLEEQYNELRVAHGLPKRDMSVYFE